MSRAHPVMPRGVVAPLPAHIAHGSGNAYAHYGCRCEPCMEGKRVYAREQRRAMFGDRSRDRRVRTIRLAAPMADVLRCACGAVSGAAHDHGVIHAASDSADPLMCSCGAVSGSAHRHFGGVAA